jgi:hypothetical protein
MALASMRMEPRNISLLRAAAWRICSMAFWISSPITLKESARVPTSLLLRMATRVL